MPTKPCCEGNPHAHKTLGPLLSMHPSKHPTLECDTTSHTVEALQSMSDWDM